MTYRACYYTAPSCQGDIVLTTPEQASLSDEALIAAAVAEAERAGILGDSLTLDELREGLSIGDYVA